MTSIESECKHGLGFDECHTCKNSQRVYTTAGGSHYHWHRDCNALDSGQEEAHLAGHKLHERTTATASSAMADNRAECRTS